MADITRDTHDDDKNYHKVTFQRGQPILDSELNEAQDNTVTSTVESFHDSMDGFRPSQEGMVTPVLPLEARADPMGCFATGIAPPNIFLSAGSVYVEGYRMVFPADVDLAALGLSFPVAPASTIYGFIYATIALAEVNAIADPDIATSQLGQTTVREQLTVTFAQATSTVDFETAWATIPVTAPAAGDRIWKGNLARVVVCRYTQPAASTFITTDDLVDQRQPTPAQLLSSVVTASQAHLRWQPGTSFWSGQGGDGTDGMVIWNEQYQKLIVGSLDDDLISPGGDQGKAGIVTGAGPRREGSWFSRTRGVAHAQSGAGDTDGTPVLQEAGWTTAGIVLNSQTAIGYLTITSGIVATDFTAPTYNNTLLHRNGPSNTVAVLQDYYTHATPAPSTYTTSGTDSVPIIVQKLVKDTLAQFQESSPQSFVLVANTGPKLIWYNGHTTQGNADYPVVVNFGGDPCPYDAIVSSDGRTHFGGPDAVERSINWLKSDVADELGQQHALSIRVRYGDWNFTRILHSFGTEAEFSGQNEFSLFDFRNNAVCIEGEGPQVSRLNTFATDDIAAGTPRGNINIRANRIVLKGLTFTQEFDATGLRNPRYTLSLFANDVIIEDCVFNGGVFIESQNIEIKNCQFYGLANPLAAPHAVEQLSVSEYVAQHLYLAPRDDGAGSVSNKILARWEVDRCNFYSYSDYGTHASLVIADNHPTFALAQTYNLSTRIHHCQWHTMLVQPQEQAAIHIDSYTHGIEIDNNRFLNANGATKIGCDLFAAAAPFNGYLHGSPVSFPGGVSGGNTTRHVTTAYISLVKPRVTRSNLDVHDNFFDLADVGYQSTDPFNLWGAMIIYPSSTSLGVLGGVVDSEICNVAFRSNTVRMGGGQGTWDAAIPTVINQTWGFYAAMSTPDGAGQEFVFKNFSVCDNSFDLGGSASGADPNYIWRAIRNESINSWPLGGTSYLTDTSCVIGVVMKNASGGLNVASRRGVNGLSVCRNQISQGWQPSAAALYGQIEFISNDVKYWWPTIICLSANNPMYTDGNQVDVNPFDASALGADGQMVNGWAGGYFWANVKENYISVPAYYGGIQPGQTSAGGSTIEELDSPDAVPHIIYMNGLLRPTFTGNQILGGDRALGDGISCIHMRRGFQMVMYANHISCFTNYAYTFSGIERSVGINNRLEFAGSGINMELVFAGGEGDNRQDNI